VSQLEFWHVLAVVLVKRLVGMHQNERGERPLEVSTLFKIFVMGLKIDWLTRVLHSIRGSDPLNSLNLEYWVKLWS
jgi:hypothetical protein